MLDVNLCIPLAFTIVHPHAWRTVVKEEVIKGIRDGTSLDVLGSEIVLIINEYRWMIPLRISFQWHEKRQDVGLPLLQMSPRRHFKKVNIGTLLHPLSGMLTSVK